MLRLLVYQIAAGSMKYKKLQFATRDTGNHKLSCSIDVIDD